LFSYSKYKKYLFNIKASNKKGNVLYFTYGIRKSKENKSDDAKCFIELNKKKDEKITSSSYDF
jgi:hypothetical protein